MVNYLDFWKGKRVLLTGHSGFKGAWHSVILADLGADVHGVSLDAPSQVNLFEKIGSAHLVQSFTGIDIANVDAFIEIVRQIEPEIVFHFAAQPLVIESYTAPRTTIESNVVGTMAVLEAIRLVDSVRTGVIVTTDKCYRNTGSTTGYDEMAPLGGSDVYSASKAAAEILVNSYTNSFFDKNSGVSVATVRAGNVIGGGDWAANRLFPDLARACSADMPLVVRNPHMTRPWQHVLEPLFGYLKVGYHLANGGEYAMPVAWNFGPELEDCVSVGTIVELAQSCLDGKLKTAINKAPAAFHEEARLTLDCTKAKAELGWNPALRLADAVALTVDWYVEEHAGGNALDICRRQIGGYKELLLG